MGSKPAHYNVIEVVTVKFDAVLAVFIVVSRTQDVDISRLDQYLI